MVSKVVGGPIATEVNTAALSNNTVAQHGSVMTEDISRTIAFKTRVKNSLLSNTK